MARGATDATRRWRFPLIVVLLVVSAAALAEEGWATYGNARFGVFVDYPASLFTVKDAPPENGDGQTFRSADGKAELAVWGSYNIDNETPEAYLGDKTDLTGATYKKAGRDFYAISGRRDQSIFYQRCNFPKGDVIACFNISYPEADKAKWDEIVKRIGQSLRTAPVHTR
jgi:hypothetical protein